jgi:hypothetical protein
MKSRSIPACLWLVKETYKDVQILLIYQHKGEPRNIKEDWPEMKAEPAS